MNFMDGNISIGWSQKDITPLKTSALVGQFRERISEYVRDPISVTALALESVDEKGRAVEQAIMLSCDLLAIDKHIQDGLRVLLAKRLPDIDCKKVFLFATHTHTAPFTSVDELAKFGGTVLEYRVKKKGVITPAKYSEFLIGQLCEAAVEAWSQRRPGGISCELGFAVVGYNRMVVYDDGSSKMYGATDTYDYNSLMGTADHGVELLYTWDNTGELTGIAVNVACPSQVVENMNYISADFWGEVRKEISKRYSKELYVLAMTGAAGDQSPRDQVRMAVSSKLMRSEEGLGIIAGRIADAVEEAVEPARSKRMNKAIFRHLVKDIRLPLRKVTRTEAEQAQIEFDRTVKEYGIDMGSGGTIKNLDASVLFYLSIREGILKRYQRQQKDPFYEMELHVVRLGDVVIATNPFELYLDYGLQIKGRSKARQTFIIELACDCGLYLPTERAVSGGGYSTQVSNGYVGPEGGRLLVDHTVKLINELMKD